MLARPRTLSLSLARLAVVAGLVAFGLRAFAQLQFEPLGKRHLPLAADSSLDVVPADLDGDGDLDLVVANNLLYATDQNRIYVNDGSAGFTDGTAARMPANSDKSSAVAVGDVDGDGDLDLAFANELQPKSLYLNDGTGRFTNASNRLPQAPRLTTSVAMGDVDGDGDLDLAFGNTWDRPTYFVGTARNELYLNDGGGFFSDAGARLPADSDFTNDVELADLDGDGDLDLLCGNADDDTSLFPLSRTKLYRNDGAGFFTDVTAGRIPPGNRGTRTVAAGDLDGDGDLDLVLGNHDRFLAQQPTLLYVNNGSGTFTDATSLRFPQDSPLRAVTDVRLADLTGDGALDVLLATYRAVDQLFVNYGSGTFFDGSSRLPQLALDTFGVAADDLDADGDADIVAVQYGAQDRLHFNDGTGKFVDASSSRIPGVGITYDVAVGDVDGDEDLDLVYANINGQNALRLNDGNGVFGDASANLPQVPSYCQDVELGDVDGDSDPDLVFADSYSGGNKLYVNEGGGVFADVSATRLPPSLGTTYALAPGDVDLDGDRDLVLGNSNAQDQLYTNLGTGAFVDATAARMPADSDSTYALALGDVEGDGDPDLVVGTFDFQGDQSRLYTNDGTGVFTDQTATKLPQMLEATQALALLDVDRDGDLDLFVGNEDFFTSGQDRLYLNDGSGTFEDVTASHLPVDDDATWSLTPFDLDQDGDLDLVVGVYGYPGSRILRNDGLGRFSDATASTTGLNTSYAPTGAGDVDADGDADLVFGGTLRVDLQRQLDSPLLVRVGQTFRLDAYARGSSPAPWAQVVVTSSAWPPQAGGTIGPGPAAARLVRIPQPSGKGSVAFLVPNDPGLAGTAVLARAFFLDPVAGTRVRSNRTADVVVK